MDGGDSKSFGSTRLRVERALRKCQEWSRAGQHDKVVSEVEQLLGTIEDHDRLRAALLTWLAQAYLALGDAQAALQPASMSWELEPSPHACHLASNALDALGDADESERLLRLGWRLFPDAIHLPVQLAVALSDRARAPEALDILDEIEIDEKVPADFQIFLHRMRANLLVTMGRWAEAGEVLTESIGAFPDSRALRDSQSAFRRQQRRFKAESSLVSSWREGLGSLDGVSGEVDEAISSCCDVNELSELIKLSARRLWRAYLDHQETRPRAPDSWAVAIVVATLEVDGERPRIALLARSFSSNPSSVRSALRRIREYLGSLDDEFKARAFAAHSNPRLEKTAGQTARGSRSAEVVPFPRP